MKGSIIKVSMLASGATVVLMVVALAILGTSFIVERIDRASTSQLSQLATIASNGLSKIGGEWRLVLSRAPALSQWTDTSAAVLGIPRAGLWLSGDGIDEQQRPAAGEKVIPFQPGSFLYAALLTNNGTVAWRSPSFENENNFQGVRQSFSPSVLASGDCEIRKGMACVLLPFTHPTPDGASHIFIGLIDEAIQSETLLLLERFYLGLLGFAMLFLVMQSMALAFAFRPLRLLSQKIKEINVGRKDKIEGPAPNELAPLIENFNQLLMSEADRRKRLRSALERLAHVLRTPLTVLKSRAYTNFDDQLVVYEQANRMLGIVDSELRKVSLAQLGSVGTVRSVLIRPVLERILQAYSGLPRLDVSQEALDFELHVSPAELSFLGVEHDLEDAFGTVLENALRFAAHRIEVKANPAADGWIKVSVLDDGAGFPAGFAEQFSSNYPLKGASSDSFGLGLSIVVEIAAHYGGDFTLKNRTSGGAQVDLFLPRGKT